MIVKAYVNRDQWIAECPNCGFALAVNRTFTHLTCGVLPDGRDLGTGCGFSAGVQFPGEADDIEAARRQIGRHGRNFG